MRLRNRISQWLYALIHSYNPFLQMRYFYCIWSDINIANHHNLRIFHISPLYRKSIIFPKSIVLPHFSIFPQIPCFYRKSYIYRYIAFSLFAVTYVQRPMSPSPPPTRYCDCAPAILLTFTFNGIYYIASLHIASPHIVIASRACLKAFAPYHPRYVIADAISLLLYRKSYI